MRKSKGLDIKDRKFGRLTALYPTTKVSSPNSKSKYWKWMCKCDCGRTLEVRKGSLLSGNTKSCGCLAKDTFMRVRRSNRIDMLDKTFGSLTVKRPIEPKTKSDILKWECECKCGKLIKVTGDRLRSGAVTSCGCEKKIPKPRTPYKPTKNKREHDIDDFMSKFFPSNQKVNPLLNVLPNTDRSKSFKELIRQSLRSLWSRNSSNFERNYYIFEQLYLNPNPPTLQELGDKFGLSRERVRQLESKSLDHLKKTFMR